MDDAHIFREGLNDSTMAAWHDCSIRVANEPPPRPLKITILYILKLDGGSSQSLVDGMNNKGEQTGLSSFVHDVKNG